MKSEALRRAVVGVLPAVVAAGLVAVVPRAEAAGGEQSGFLQWLRRDRESQKEFIGQERDAQRQGGKPRSARAETPSAPSLFISAPPSWVTAGSVYRYTPLLGTNLPGFVFHAELAPSGMVVSAGTGAISWTPSEAQAGSHPVRLAVCGAGLTNRQEFTVTVARLLELGSSTIGTNGGSLGAGECLLRVPTGALQQATQLMLASPSTPPDLESQWGVRPCGRIYVPRHAGSERSKQGPLAVPGATLTLSVDPAALPPGTDAGVLRLCTYDPVLDVVLVADLPRQRPVPAGAAAVSAAVLFGSYYFVGVPVEWLAYEEFKAQGDGYTRVYYRSSLIGPNRAAAEAYATTVVQGIAEARDKAKGLGFAVPSSPTVWVGNFGWDAEGQYLAAWERIMLKHTLLPRTLLSAPAHEFFHAVQDEYYNLGLAGQTDWIAWTFWWSEASSTWFQSLFDPKMITDRIGGYASGYLRTPLGCGGREGAYAQASLLCYAEAKKPGYVREVFDGSCGLWTGVFSAMKKALPLDEHYRKYVLWALEKYGTPLWCDGWLVALEDGSGEVTDRFNAKGDLQVEKKQVAPLPVLGRETNVLEVVIRDTAGVAPYYANIYKVRSDHDTDAPRNATTKAVSVRFEAAGGVGRDIPFVLVRDAYGKIIAQHDLAGPGFLRVHNFGRGPTDTAAELTLVHASTDGSPAGERTWTIRVREFDPWVGPWRGVAGGSANVGPARLTRLEVNGQAYDSYAAFDAWLRPALQKMLDESQKPDLGILDSAVGLIGNMVGGIVLELFAAAVKTSFEGGPLYLSFEPVSADTDGDGYAQETGYLPTIPGMSAESLAKMRSDTARFVPLHVKGGSPFRLEGTWDKLDEPGAESKTSLTWDAAMQPGCTTARVTLSISSRSTDPNSKALIRTLDATLEAGLTFVTLDEGLIPREQDYLAAIKTPWMLSFAKFYEEVKKELGPLLAPKPPPGGQQAGGSAPGGSP